MGTFPRLAFILIQTGFPFSVEASVKLWCSLLERRIDLHIIGSLSHSFFQQTFECSTCQILVWALGMHSEQNYPRLLEAYRLSGWLLNKQTQNY